VRLLQVLHCTEQEKFRSSLFKGLRGQGAAPLSATAVAEIPKRSASAGESEFCELASKRERTLAGGPLFLLFIVYFWVTEQQLKKPLRDFIFFLWHYRRKEKRNKKETPKGDAVAFEKAPQNFQMLGAVRTLKSAHKLKL
jgi:hypothetical protein